MSALYDQVCMVLKVAAKRQEAMRTERPAHQHQWMVLNPSDWAAVQNELGGPSISTQVLQTPGTWLLGVDVLCDEKQLPGTVTLRTEEHY